MCIPAAALVPIAPVLCQDQGRSSWAFALGGIFKQAIGENAIAVLGVCLDRNLFFHLMADTISGGEIWGSTCGGSISNTANATLVGIAKASSASRKLEEQLRSKNMLIIYELTTILDHKGISSMSG